ncbi:MAG TPA: glycine cleavage system protein GcvH [Clostridiales bacterium]|nr:glycine cleavage system protein GcvH [Clostridiales bacterium]
MNNEILYTDTHEWVQFLDETTVRIGLTDFAQSELGDLVFVNLPEEGDELTAGETFADVESVKAVSDVYSPVTGEVSKVNEDLLDHPELINSDPMEAWLIEVENVSDKENMLTEEEYKKLIS